MAGHETNLFGVQYFKVQKPKKVSLLTLGPLQRFVVISFVQFNNVDSTNKVIVIVMNIMVVVVLDFGLVGESLF